MFSSGTLMKHRVYMEVMCISSAKSRISVYPENFPVRGKCVHYWSWKPTPFLENSISILGLTHFLPPEDAAGRGVSQLYCVIMHAELEWQAYLLMEPFCFKCIIETSLMSQSLFKFKCSSDSLRKKPHSYKYQQ